MAARSVDFVEDALDALVNQFADPLSFFRELVQNSIDAGSTEIDIALSHAEGLSTIEVQDFGQGMDRAIIDKRLTRLFSSSKDGDLTKIGRFGIGFVSVFAIEPDAVCVDTSRGGQRWRVLFGADRSFERIVLDEAVEGTRIRIFKRMSRSEHDEFALRARSVVEHWCRYAAAEIRFDGDVINESFTLDSACQVVHIEEGTRIIVALAEGESPVAGFYNRGLTLLEGESEIPCVCFRIDSRYLEHTLSRDNILRDEGFDKAMRLVWRLVNEKLGPRILQDLRDGARERTDAHYRWLAQHVLPRYMSRERLARSQLEEMPIFATLHGQSLTVRQVIESQAAGSLYYESVANPVTELLSNQGAHVVAAKHSTAVYGALKSVVAEPLRVRRSLCTALAARDSAEAQRWRALSGAVHNLLDDFGARLEAVRLGHLRYRGSPVADRIAITQRTFGELTAVTEAEALSTSWFGRKRIVVLNADHAAFGELLVLARAEPELAAYLVVKLLLLRGQLSMHQDGQLTAISQEQRWRRRTS